MMRKKKQPKNRTDAYGFPDPGSVIRQYREKLTYHDPETGTLKHWTQTDLAQRLGVSEVMVRLMETQNKGLDSIERRRVLANILKIPPVLLGLAALPDLPGLENALTQPGGKEITLAKNPHETVQLYQDSFKMYHALHTMNTAQDSLSEMERWIVRIESDLPAAPQTARSSLLPNLWNFHDLAAKIYSDDLTDWHHAFTHLNSAIQLAAEIDSPDLQAASLYRSGQVHFAQRNYELAKRDLDGAILYAKKASSPAIKGTIFCVAATAYALTGRDLASADYARSLLDQAEPLALLPGVEQDSIHFGIEKFTFEKADTYTILGRPGKAIELLEDAEEQFDPTHQRRLAYVSILKADAYIKLKRPEYDTACYLLLQALAVSKKIGSAYNINYIKRMFTLLDQSKYTASPQLADLRLALREKNS